MQPHCAFQSRRAADLRRGAVRAADVQNPERFTGLSAAREFLFQPLNEHVALRAEVRADPAGIQVLILRGNLPVHEDDGDLRLLCLLEDVFPARFHDRGEDDVVDLFLDEIADGQKLVLLLLLGVVKQQFKSVLLGKRRGHGLGIRRTPVRFGAQLGEADPDQPVLFRAGDTSAGTQQKKQQDEESREYVAFFHADTSV